MKLLILLLPFYAFAGTYIMPDLNDPNRLKVETRSDRPASVICDIQDQNGNASDYKIEVIKGELGLVDRAKRLVGLNVEVIRDWTPGETLAEGESIQCSIDSTKKKAREDAEKAKANAEKVKADKKKNDLDAFCRSPKAGIETFYCQDKGYEYP